MSARDARDGPGIPFVIAAPSGTGKTTVCRRVVAADPGIGFSISHTTRPRREAEREGVDYHFVTPERFDELVRQGAFLEWAEYNGNRYGTSAQALEQGLAAGSDLLLEIEIQGARQVRARRSDARLVFLLPPSMQVLERRLAGRATDSPEAIHARLATARRELEAVLEFDYAVFNDDLDHCVEQVLEIVRAERRGEVATARQRFDPAAAARRLGGAERIR